MSRPWDVVEISNRHGIRARVASYGARLLELWTPDRAGKLDDVVLGFPTLEGYHSTRSAYIGCIVGRVANRIRDAQFSLDGTTYLLTANEPPNHLHGGGDRAFDNLVWSVDPQTAIDSVTFRVVSQHLDEGYPGVVRAAVTYALTDRDELVIDLVATPDRRTPVSLAHHSYWNLGGHQGLRDILDHELRVAASSYTPIDDARVPTGMISAVDASPFDFRRPRRIGAQLATLRDGPTGGYDHNLVLDGSSAPSARPRFAARLRDPRTGRVLELSTTAPGLQVYSGQSLPTVAGKHGGRYGPFSGLALEPQAFPNAVNEPAFPPIIVDPTVPYRQRSTFRFLVD